MNLDGMYKGTWLFLALFSAAVLLGGPAHALFEDHGGEIGAPCEGHSPLDHVEGMEGGLDLTPCDLCLTFSSKFGIEFSPLENPFPGQVASYSSQDERRLSSSTLSLPLLRAPPVVIP